MFERGDLGKPPSPRRLSFAHWRVLGSMGDGVGSLAMAQDAVPWRQFQVIISANSALYRRLAPANGDQSFRGQHGHQVCANTRRKRRFHKLSTGGAPEGLLVRRDRIVCLVWDGETVYRLLFSEFDGAKDRIPIEALFGFAFAWLATKFVGDAYRNRKERRARLNFIWARNHQIRGALEGITPLAHPAKNQQSIRVIREEVDRIEWALKKILPR